VTRVRFAPSPTGFLHVGNARTALFNWMHARHLGGSFVLRIEDTDAERSTEASAGAILDDLRWLGLDWDEGPGIGGPHGPYLQSARLAIYREHADRLLRQGRAYRCFCSRQRIETARAAALAAGRTPQYDGTCRAVPADEAERRAAAGAPCAIRFRVPDHPATGFMDLVRGAISVETTTIGDFVLLRDSGLPAYNFAVVVDDALMGISEVIRGEDHIPNTPRQVLLYEALGYRVPAFAHVSLVLGPDQAPLSKRHGATSVGEFRHQGILPEALVNYLALIGWSPGHDEELLPLAELSRRFSIDRVNRSAGVFDPMKLAWVNRHYQRLAEPARLAALLVPFLLRAGLVTRDTPEVTAFVQRLVPIVAGAVDTLSEAPERVRSVFVFDTGDALRAAIARLVAETPEAAAVVVALAQALSQHARLTRESFREVAQVVRGRTGVKGRALFHSIRVALTGEDSGPELDLLVPAIEAGAEWPAAAGLHPVLGCRERAAASAATIGSEPRT
jgi:nondiscriminating glutamyl-tRNA synthetase